MSTTSKSPRRVAAVAYEVGRRSLPEYASRFSRKDFTQPQLLADAGYDSEMNHELLHDKRKIDSLIPAKIGRPTSKLPTGGYRFQMQTNFDDQTYGQRWQIQTLMFMLKRHQGEALPASKPDTRHRELGLTVLAHNIMVVRA
jgi:DDE family transposase